MWLVLLRYFEAICLDSICFTPTFPMFQVSLVFGSNRGVHPSRIGRGHSPNLAPASRPQASASSPSLLPGIHHPDPGSCPSVLLDSESPPLLPSSWFEPDSSVVSSSVGLCIESELRQRTSRPLAPANGGDVCTLACGIWTHNLTTLISLLSETRPSVSIVA